MSENNEAIHTALKKVSEEFNNGTFAPILEDDFVARFYHHVLNHNNNTYANKIFVKTRILQNISGSHRERKYDIAIGQRKRDAKRDYVDPEDILEFKIFPHGFTPQQLIKRRKGVIEDIDKLYEILSLRNDIRLHICLFDMLDWLDRYDKGDGNTRIENIIQYRNKLDKPINIMRISVIGNKAKIIHSPCQSVT